jgi:hypothetical protein
VLEVLLLLLKFALRPQPVLRAGVFYLVLQNLEIAVERPALVAERYAREAEVEVEELFGREGHDVRRRLT